MNIDPKSYQELVDYVKTAKPPKVAVRSSFLFGDEELALLVKKFPILKDAELTAEKDSSLLAGFILIFGSKSIDVTLAREIHQLHQLFV